MFQELDNVEEVLFFHQGAIDLGYEINRKKVYKLRFREPNVVGAFNVTFNRKSLFVTKAYKECQGFSIRKNNWNEILKDSPEIASAFKHKIIFDFYKEVRQPMLVQKNRDIKNICSKSKWGDCLYHDVDL